MQTPFCAIMRSWIILNPLDVCSDPMIIIVNPLDDFIESEAPLMIEEEIYILRVSNQLMTHIYYE